MSRMDRYKAEDTPRSSRIDKNKELYQNVSNNTIYTNITDVINANAYEINNNSEDNYKTREAYQQMQKYGQVERVPKTKKELDDFNHLYQRQENKIYDINSVLEEARKNRGDNDALEEKRKLKNKDYNILAGLTKKDLEKYREEKKKRVITPEEEEIREFTDTIISKTLAGEIDQRTSVDLLSDLMATNILDTVKSPEIETEENKEEKEEQAESKDEIDETILTLSKQVLDDNQIKEVERKSKNEPVTSNPLGEKDTDFYTRSMDLSDKDFGLNNEEKKLPVIVKIFLFLLIIAVLAVAGYFIYQKFM